MLTVKRPPSDFPAVQQIINSTVFPVMAVNAGCFGKTYQLIVSVPLPQVMGVYVEFRSCIFTK